MNEGEKIQLLKEIWEATQGIKTLDEKVNDFDKRLEKMEERCGNIWHRRGTQFIADHEKNIEKVVDIFEKDYGYKQKVSGFDLVTTIFNKYAKTLEKKNVIFTSILNSTVFRLIEILSFIILFILFGLKVI